MNNFLNLLKQPCIILILIAIILIIVLLGYIDDKINKKNKKSKLGYAKLVIIGLLCALLMLWALSFFCDINLSEYKGNGILSKLSSNNINKLPNVSVFSSPLSGLHNNSGITKNAQGITKHTPIQSPIINNNINKLHNNFELKTDGPIIDNFDSEFKTDQIMGSPKF